MKRMISSDLNKWLYAENRKPLILRGARQVGKTWSVRQLAKENDRTLIEINFERNPELAELFSSNDPSRIIENLEGYFNMEIVYDKTILFLDEIQATSQLIAKLRWFYEEMPQLPVIAAGSLLEFALKELDYSMPVGRVSYMFMNPMSFREFLWAMNEEKLSDMLEKAVDSFEISKPLHEKATELFNRYCVVSGMPEAVNEYVKSRKITAVEEIQRDLLQTYMDDFNKYRKRMDPSILRMTLIGVTAQLGERFTYTHVSKTTRSKDIKNALSLLSLAGLVTKVVHTAANGVPLGYEENEEIFKVVFLDTGLALNILGYRPNGLDSFQERLWVNKGAIAEQIVAQQMIAASSPQRSSLHYWQQIGSMNGEVDYVISENTKVIPVEVKAGASGSMKSLHNFMEKKNLDEAIRFDDNLPSKFIVDVKTTQSKPVKYTLNSYPLYMSEFVFSKRLK